MHRFTSRSRASFALTALAMALALSRAGAEEPPAPAAGTAAPGTAPAGPAAAGAGTAEAASAAPTSDPNDHRAVIRLRVRNEFKPEDVVTAQVIEGRFLNNLADMETFRMVSSDNSGDYLLTCSVLSINLATGDYYSSPMRDAESGDNRTTSTRLTITMDMRLLLENAAGKEVYRGKLSSEGGRDIDTSIEATVGLARQDMIDQAAVRLERLLRKKLKKL